MENSVNNKQLTLSTKLSKIDESLKNTLFKSSELVESESIEIMTNNILDNNFAKDDEEDDLSSFDIEKDIMDDSDEFMIDALEDQGD